jgi:hypothetical protein
MRTFLRGKVTPLFMMLGMLLAVPAIALADIVANDLDTTVDNTAEVMPLQVGGANGTTKLYVLNTNSSGSGFGSGFSDPNNACNLAGASNLQLDVTSSNPSVATVSPASVTINDCGEPNGVTITVSPVAAGSTQITVARKAGTTSSAPGTFHFGPATFDVNVTPPPNTPPQVQVAGVEGGASYAKGSVPTATCQVTDQEDGNSSFPATLGPITGPYASDGIGTQEASCSYTDNGPGPGLTATASVFYNIVDPSPPSIDYQLNPADPDGANGWYKGNVSLTWIVSDEESPNSLQKTSCVDQNITADQQATEYKCSATSAGGSAPEQTVTIKRDGTAPEITDDGRKTQPNADGWYASEAFNKFSASDATSGLADSTKASFEVGTGTQEGSGLTVASGPVSDNAGNSAASVTSTATYNVDLSDPTNVAFQGGPAAGSSHDFGSVPAAPTCTADDAVSGLKSCVVTGYGTGVGSHTMTATATDKAGRTATATRTYTVAAATAKGFYQPVDMGNVTNTVKGGSTVPLKFELFGGATNTEQKNVSAVTSVSAKQITCGTTPGSSDAIEEIVSTNATGLRFDTTGDQFIYNWKTSKSPGTCYLVTMTAADQQTKLLAYFKLS